MLICNWEMFSFSTYAHETLELLQEFVYTFITKLQSSAWCYLYCKGKDTKICRVSHIKENTTHNILHLVACIQNYYLFFFFLLCLDHSLSESSLPSVTTAGKSGWKLGQS